MSANGEGKHTTGPWSYSYKSEGYSQGEVYRKDNLIAIVCGSNYGEWRDATDNGEGEFEANARLIAAAPDLLIALQELLEKHERVARSFDCIKVAAARLAIAKATGNA